MSVEVLKGGAERFVTEGGIAITRERHETPYHGAIEAYVDGLDSRRGAVFSSNYEYPGRYTRWDTAIIDPPLVISAHGRAMRIEALNGRGEVLLPTIGRMLERLAEVTVEETTRKLVRLTVARPSRVFTEEERSRVPSVFTVLRAVTGLFRTQEDANLGLYGAFGYDLAFQFDPVEHVLTRQESQRDLVLFLPDEILVVDHYLAKAWHDRYDYAGQGFSTEGLPRRPDASPFKQADRIPPRGDHEPGEYARLVERAKESFRRGDLFEVVPGQMFMERCDSLPSEICRRLKAINPSPYSFFINLGEGEYLIGASPEMFVRVNGRRVETCPISGTIKRGGDAISDFGADPQAPQLQEGRVGAHHVLRRRPQRQEPRLRARFGAGDRPAADRDVFAADPHGRPHRGPPLRRHGRVRRLPVACLGGDRHRGAEAVGDALHRAEREEPARLVWRGDRHGALQRRPEHRTDAAHHSDQGRHSGGSRRRHLAL